MSTGCITREVLDAQEQLAEFRYVRKPAVKGYTGEMLRVDLGDLSCRIIPVTEELKLKFTGGKGFDLWLLWNEVNPNTKWDSPENAICISAGPLGGSPAFPGSGKSIVTTISPTTGSVIDSNVGGHFGPLLKFAGFDALCVTGRRETRDHMVMIDGATGAVRFYRNPELETNSHILAGQLSEMLTDNQEDRRNFSSVSAGTGSDHTWIGCLNFSFWDWRRNHMRLKQAGRGGCGTVLRGKGLKALAVRAPRSRPEWRRAEGGGE
jgi:aldehyde:ferredoxin oxidoreductase